MTAGRGVSLRGGTYFLSGSIVFEPADSGTPTARITYCAYRGEKVVLSGAVRITDWRPGMRPICQARKLLDADPVVRRMAEQDILVMGRAAAEYLVRQHGDASPGLRSAIENNWTRIVAEER